MFTSFRMMLLAGVTTGTVGQQCLNSESLAVPNVAEGRWTGATGIHDPTQMLALQDGTLVVFASGSDTGPSGECGIAGRYLPAGTTSWEAMGPMFGGCSLAGDFPSWWSPGHTDNTDADAPEVLYSATPNYRSLADGNLHNFVMYYSLYLDNGADGQLSDSVDGSGQACIGRATADYRPGDNLRRLRWTDDGVPVLCSNVILDSGGRPSRPRFADEAALCAAHPEACTYAIDPAIHTSFDGARMWMSYGSGTILAVELNITTGHLIAGARPGYSPARSAAGFYTLLSIGSQSDQGTSEPYFNEAPYIFKHIHSGTPYYYLFTNWYVCCGGRQSTYQIMVGRSTSPTGPFVDVSGRRMDQSTQTVTAPDGLRVLAGGGTIVLGNPAVGNARYIGPGHAGVLEYTARNGQTRYVLSFHFYDRNECGYSKIGARPLAFDSSGWPIVAASPWDPTDMSTAQTSTIAPVTAAPFTTAPTTAAPTALGPVGGLPLCINPSDWRDDGGNECADVADGQWCQNHGDETFPQTGGSLISGNAACPACGQCTESLPATTAPTTESPTTPTPTTASPTTVSPTTAAPASTTVALPACVGSKIWRDDANNMCDDVADDAEWCAEHGDEDFEQTDGSFESGNSACAACGRCMEAQSIERSPDDDEASTSRLSSSNSAATSAVVVVVVVAVIVAATAGVVTLAQRNRRSRMTQPWYAVSTGGADNESVEMLSTRAGVMELEASASTRTVSHEHFRDATPAKSLRTAKADRPAFYNPTVVPNAVNDYSSPYDVYLDPERRRVSIHLEDANFGELDTAT